MCLNTMDTWDFPSVGVLMLVVTPESPTAVIQMTVKVVAWHKTKSHEMTPWTNLHIYSFAYQNVLREVFFFPKAHIV